MPLPDAGGMRAVHQRAAAVKTRHGGRGYKQEHGVCSPGFPLKAGARQPGSEAP
jgi:hypothetical protein